MKKSPQNLKTGLFLVPSLSLLACFCLILLLFNLVIQQYIEVNTAKAMSDQFTILNSFYQNRDLPMGEEEEVEDVIIYANYLITDEAGTLLYPDTPWFFPKERKLAEVISAFYQEQPQLFDNNKAGKIEHEKKTYYVRAQQYQGIYGNTLIYPATNPEEEREYIALVYTNITPIQNFLNLLNRTLFLLMIATGILSFLIIFGMAKRIDKSFNRLKNYILKVGKREPLPPLEEYPYNEFNKMAETVRDMSAMIDRAQESQKTFFQNASHELRTPLMTIQGYAEGISTGVMKNPKDTAEIIIQESSKMSTLVDEILFLSRMDVDFEQIKPETLSLQELLLDATGQIKVSADKKGLALVHHFPEADIQIQGDERLLERAFSNLLSNALRYARTQITVSCLIIENEALVTIEDDGTGISDKDLPHIFDRFYKGAQGNFGIGLAITKDIFTRHKGSVTATSTPGSTVFHVTLPALSSLPAPSPSTPK